MLSSGSQLARNLACAASNVLPRTQTTSAASLAGKELHADLEGRLEISTKMAVEAMSLPEDILLRAELGYVMTRSDWRLLGQVKERDYAQRDSSEIFCTLDLAGRFGNTAVVVDWKSGQYSTPAKDSWQLRFGALCVARTSGCDSARVAIASMASTGDPHWDVADFDGFQLDGFEKRLREFQEERLSPEAMEGAETRAHIGPWCRYCPSYLYCPAQTSLIKLLATAPHDIQTNFVNALTPETAAKAYERLRAVEGACNAMRTALYGYAAQFPIPLADGMVFGPVVTKRETVDGSAAFNYLLARYGGEVAQKACEMESSKAAIGRILPRQQAKEAIDGIRKLGGISVKVTETIREHKQRGE